MSNEHIIGNKNGLTNNSNLENHLLMLSFTLVTLIKLEVSKALFMSTR